ncbi:histidine phosphatase family protein [Methylobacterium oryzihabitans]|uniref:Histidine phosphatase family protein n=1 Tax=Methylobacterium oryzihabitans TaxID=2499852 RepID=A0A3S2XQI2_9HYPH|nr:histidine phosphatase family protein [Methylobacterium oryzihabitans]RVU20533.1 histidine phosphatase family protein [Methylobacterium oryzihabitans]
MTVLRLVRHASHGRVGSVLCGRMPGVTLDAAGLEEADALARRLAGCGAERVLTSPQPRAGATAAPVAAALGLTAEVADDLDEIDFGAWTGRGFADLDGDPDWRAWNERRGSARPPGGESMAQAQDRIVGLMDRLAEAGNAAILVGHGEVIRAALLHVLGLPLDAWHRIEVAPASVSMVELWAGGGRVPGRGRVLGLNERVAP